MVSTFFVNRWKIDNEKAIMIRKLLKLAPLGLLLTLILAACSAAPTPEPHQFAGGVLPTPEPAPNFTLMSADGPVSLSDYEDQFVFLYFGYTFCPDVCPATLSDLAKVKESLGEDGEKMQVIMITVDPERDTPEKLAEYMDFFDTEFVGLSGSKEEIDAVGQPYGVYYEAHEGTAESGYLVDHSTRTYLIDDQGLVRLAYPYGVEAQAIQADMEYLLSESS